VLFRSGDFSLERFLDLCCIDYISPGDAASTGLRPRSIDFHTSYTVLEHIPPDVLSAILKEGTRIIRDDGLFVHLVDYTDHFAHSDESISAINFLQYSDAEWSKLAENRYMYMNRLRHDDVLALFQTAGHRILATDPAVNKQLAKIIEDGQLRLSERFVGKSPDVLSIWSCWIVSQKAVAEAGADYQTDSTSS